MVKIEKLLDKSIYWQNHPTNKRYFFAQDDNEIILLRLNDFPDEPLWTLIKGLEILDIDDAPSQWFIPFENISS